ncbi:germin-like protein subfamily 1 member 1 [Prunus yedoensis var. nudiflora]|uniref:Germin-like protein n=1 Tax=Prunus yedoensis var. nudiflora TaxID=2094558 RepID=A0A314YPZ4_PRUYE|nr:germin-like protein subfamily 1 member 1 [Prunus yedoensis var. nudiflora]
MARVDIAANGIVPPHLHPRASEVQLKPGESYVFPKGLIHFVYNYDSVNPALALAGFSSQNPGVQIVSLATSLQSLQSQLRY